MFLDDAASRPTPPGVGQNSRKQRDALAQSLNGPLPAVVQRTPKQNGRPRDIVPKQAPR
jgi:hypothetical protein